MQTCRQAFLQATDTTYLTRFRAKINGFAPSTSAEHGICLSSTSLLRPLGAPRARARVLNAGPRRARSLLTFCLLQLSSCDPELLFQCLQQLFAGPRRIRPNPQHVRHTAFLVRLAPLASLAARFVSSVSTTALSSPRSRPNPQLPSLASVHPRTALRSQASLRRAPLLAAHLRPDDALEASAALDGASLARVCVSPLNASGVPSDDRESVDHVLPTSLNTKAPGPGATSRAVTAWTCAPTGAGAGEQHSPAPRTQRRVQASAGARRREAACQA